MSPPASFHKVIQLHGAAYRKNSNKLPYNEIIVAYIETESWPTLVKTLKD